MEQVNANIARLFSITAVNATQINVLNAKTPFTCLRLIITVQQMTAMSAQALIDTFPTIQYATTATTVFKTAIYAIIQLVFALDAKRVTSC